MTDLFEVNTIAGAALLAVLFGKATWIQLPRAFSSLTPLDLEAVLASVQRSLSERFGLTMAQWIC